jgi:nucleoid-associated protein EbfC
LPVPGAKTGCIDLGSDFCALVNCSAAAADQYSKEIGGRMAKGFKGPKGGGSMGSSGMMGQLQKLQEQLEAAQAQLAEETVTATSGGGAVKVTVTGDQRCRSVEIDPEVLKDGDVEMIQDLILTAFNSALDKSRDLAAERLGPLAGGLPF